MNASSEKTVGSTKSGSLYESLQPEFLKNLQTTRVRLNILFGAVTICGIIPLVMFGDRILAGFIACLALLMMLLSQKAFLAADLAKTHIDTVVDAVSDAMIVFDENGQILSANRAAARLFALKRSGMQGEKISKILDLDANKITASGRITTTLKHQGGGPVTITLSTYPFKDDYSERILAVVQKVPNAAILE